MTSRSKPSGSPRDRIHTHADFVVELGLLDEADHPARLDRQHAEIDVDLAVIRGDGERDSGGGMGLQKCREAQIREDVAVEDEELLRQLVEKRDHRSHGAERLVLGGVIHLEAPLLAAADVCSDQLAQVTDGDGYPPEVVSGKLAQDDLDDGALVADRDQRLGDAGRVRTEAGALSACQQDGVSNAHRALIPCTRSTCSAPGSPAARTTRRSWPAPRRGSRSVSSRSPL